MKRGRGGDSVEALRRIWMEGYERGKADAKPPVVEIKDFPFAETHCADPNACPVCSR